MTLFVSVISHGHTEDILQGLLPHRLQNENIRIQILDNKPDDQLADYCQKHNINYLKNDQPKGFGANHNRVFQHCREQLGMKTEDWFLVLNPDVRVTLQVLHDLLATLNDAKPAVAAPNLFKDDEFKVLEGSVRYYPYLWDFIASFLIGSNRTTLKRRHIEEPCPVDWASGAFLVFKAGIYQKLGGFDERYYLYCEDVDICWRALKLEGARPMYLPHIKAVHEGKRDSHKSVNRFLLWHISSAFRFSWVRMKTSLLGARSLTRPSL